MKKIRIEKGRLIAYIQQYDIETLVNTVKTLKELQSGKAKVKCEGILDEIAVLKGECNEDGYYRISKLENVNYIKSCPYIPNYDYLLKLDKNQIESMTEKAESDGVLLDILISKGYRRRSSISPKSRRILSCIQILDGGTVDKMEEVSKDTINSREPAYTNLAVCLKEQINCYLDSMEQMLEKKKSENKSEKKTFTLKKIREFFTT